MKENKGIYNIGRHEGNPFNLDVWYPLVKDITFKSYFIPLEREEGKVIFKYYKSKADITYNEYKILESLERKIDTVIQNNDNLKKNGAFIRLIDRSPKDGDPYNNEKVLEEYKNNLEKLSKELNKDTNDNNIRRASMDKTHMLIVRNGKEALNLVLTSERNHIDINDWIENGGKQQIVLREWNNELSLDYEFRVFIYNNRITAISQYDLYGLFPHLIEEKEKIKKLIHDFWEKEVKNKIKFPFYIVDFGYINGNIIFIELSPFLPTTGAGLYHWNYDLNELENGEGNIRIREQELENLDVLVDDWEDQMKNAEKYDEIYEKFSYMDKIKNYFNFFNTKPKENDIFIFVASVLKKDFYWNKKFLKDFIDEGQTDGIGLVTDNSGMGWISKGKKIKGEIWKIKESELIDIEYFYGLCDKKESDIITKNNGVIKCIYYELNSKYLKDKKEIEDYTLDYQMKNYNPILHQVMIEEIYLGKTFDNKKKNN